MTTHRAATDLDLRRYWAGVYGRLGGVDERADPELLDLVIHADAPVWFNRYQATFQRRAFLDALRAAGDIRGKDALEIGCGSGRWSRLLHQRGARLLAIDLSPEIVARNRERIPGVRFEAVDVVELDLPERSLDLAVSVTVLQHLPPAEQEAVAEKLGRFLRTGGALIMLENVRDRSAHVFARTPDQWLELFARNGFRLVWMRGYGYDLALRMADSVVASLRRAPPPSRTLAPSGETQAAGQRSLLAHAYWNAVRRPLTFVSYALEPVFERTLPDHAATHAAFVLRREA